MLGSRGTVNSLAQRVGYPRIFKPQQKHGVVMIYGDTGTRDSWFAFNLTALYPNTEVNRITEAGFPVASIDMLTYWGNDTIQGNIDTLLDNCSDIFGGWKVHLIGVSAGGLTVLNWARNNPEKVRSLQVLIPVLDVQDVYDHDRSSSGFTAEISTAYGGRPGDDYNPASHPEDYAQFPLRVVYSTTDTVTPLSITEAFIAGVGGDNLTAESMGAQGHSWLLSSVWSAASATAFIEAND